MKLFRDRLDMGLKLQKMKESEMYDFYELSRLDEQLISQAIDIDALATHNIPIPQEGDKLDIIYVETALAKAKSSDKMTLLRYA
jgi:hypothetical protein